MKKKFLLALLGLIFVAAAPAMAQPSPQMSTYQSIPFWLDGKTVPQVMLVLERDWKMFYPAYNNLADLDGDGALDIGFNPAVTYVGYFDSESCYEYKRNGFSPNSSNDEKGYFVRAGATTPQTQLQADTLAASRGIDATNLAYPASVHGVCGGGGTRSQGLGLWHGNWLNYALTSRMDAIRKVLYGGKRVPITGSTEDPTRTMLEMVRVPANANVWGGELYSDDVWETYAPSSPWYDIELFTGFEKPVAGAMHFWARGDYFWGSPVYTTSSPTPSSTATQQQSVVKNTLPLFRFVANVPSTNRHPFLKVPLRIWDWTGDHASYNSIPSDGHLANSRDTSGAVNSGFMAGTKNVAWNFAARVEVCQKGNISPTEGCRAYQSNYKPIGLLQEYGESSRMYFGLLTGTIHHPSPYGVDSGTRYKGGVVRHHIQDFNKYVNVDGTIVRPGLINTIDVFEITGVGSARSYSDGSQAGNPLGEMVWEAVRYLGGVVEGLDKSSAYGGTATESTVTSVTNGSFTLTKLGSWMSTGPGFSPITKRPTLDGTGAEQCPKPVILAISEVFPDHDDDDYPNIADFKNVPRSSFAAAGNIVPAGQFDINKYLEIITNTDKLSTATSGGKLFFYPSARGLCTARALGGLKDILGHCPSEPSLEGTYNLAAVAYYAHTHDFGSIAGPDGEPSNIDFYAVGIPGNFPDITLTVDDSHSMTLMPMALTAPLDASSSLTEGKSDSAFRTLLNFFIEYWQTDDGHNYLDNGVQKHRKIPYKVKFRTNFEFTMYPCFVYGGNSNNWERDLFNAFTISLLTPQSTSRQYRENEPLFINSGPFKTRDRNLYRTQRTAYRNAAKLDPTVNPDNYFIENSNQKYYYAFKKTKGVALDISTLTVVGVAVHSDSTGSGYGASGQTGYTITGVTFPGAYLDVGLNRSDYPVYYSAINCKPNMGVFVPNTTCGDEEVPLDPSGSGLPGSQWNYTSNGTHDTPSGFNSHRSGSTVYTNNADCGYYHPPTMWDELLTPAECPYAGYKSTDSWTDTDLIAAYSPKPNHEDVCGQFAAGYKMSGLLKTYPTATNDEGFLFNTSKMRYVQVRSFKFNTSGDRPQKLNNPMWLAAKYGGFKDANDNGIPDIADEWIRGGDGVGSADPYNYFGVANMSELPDQLGKAFEAIANSVATGTANASSVSMVLGGGVSVQTQYRTDYKTNEIAEHETEAKELKVKWAGSVYALFMDKWGNLRADTNGNGMLDLVTSPPKGLNWNDFHPNITKPVNPDKYEIGDLIVHQVASSGTSLPTVYLCRDVYGDNNGGNYLPSEPGQHPGSVTYPPYSDCKEVSGGLDSIKPLWNAAKNVSDMNVAKRNLYTYYGTDKPNGLKAWTPADISTYKFESAVVAANTHMLHILMGQDNITDTKSLIEYIRGTDFPSKYRNRTVRLPWDAEHTTPKVWRMGDVIHSRPVLVGEPNSNFHLIYGDQSYADYRDKQARRRQVAYFGSNDGILHAVNLGFFGALSSGQAGYSPLAPTDPDGTTPKFALGDEMWGYLPPSVLPHLQWVANESYQHSYFVDLKPYIVDVKDNRNTTIPEAEKWRTIMIVGLRLGGAPIELRNGDSSISYTTPEFFALDITDPEVTPKLLWRFSDRSLGQSTALPAVVRSGYDDKWYVVLPSGPVQTDTIGNIDFDKADELYAGRSTDNARVLILDVLTGQYARGSDRAGTPPNPDPLVVTENRSFFNDTFTPRAIKENINKSAGTWGHHTVYLGMSSQAANDYDHGAVYRLQMVKSTGEALPVDDWKLTRFYKTDKPVTAAVNSTYDQLGNLWVLFGTGRIWGQADMTPCVGRETMTPSCSECYEQYVYGVKEPLDANGRMTFAEVLKDDKIVDVSGVTVFTNGNIEPSVSGHSQYESLYTYMLSKAGNVPVVNGYKAKLESWRKDANNYDSGTQTFIKPSSLNTVFELIDTQIKVDKLASGRLNAVVSTYIPSDDICKPLGESYLTVFDAFTGLPAPYMGVYGGITGISKNFSGKIASQVTVTKKAGVGKSSEAVVIKTEKGTIYRTIGFLGQPTDFLVPPGAADTSRFISWREVTDMNFDLKEDTNVMFKDVVTP